MQSADHPSASILIADDQADIVESLRLLLKGAGYASTAASSPQDVLGALGSAEHDVLLMDLNYTRDTTSGEEGLDLLSRIREQDPHLPIVVMTAWGSVELAVEAMRRGARDFVEKPWENTRLVSILKTQISLGRALRKSRLLEAENELLRGEGAEEIIAESPAMREVLEVVRRVAPSDANVLITGENGVGKGVVARAVHGLSGRAAMPIITVNAGGLPDGVFESEMFGHVRGAFTDARAHRVGRLELAHGGTLFLDEIANMSLNHQQSLLRVLETGELERVGSSSTRRVDVRLLSATNSDPDAEVNAGRFRKDLLFRINTIEIHVPPLRERPQDIRALAMRFLALHGPRHRKAVDRFEPDAMDAMMGHSWPGNVRELDHAVERGILLARGDSITAPDLALRPGRDQGIAPGEMSLEEMERMLIRKALAKFDGNVSQAAEALGLSRSALYRRLQRYEL